MKPPATTVDLAAALADMPLFRGLPMKCVGNIAQSTREIKAANGDFIFRQGLRPKAFYHLLSGQVKLAVASDAGDEKVLEVYGPGQTFGVAELFGSNPCLSFAEATRDALLLEVDRDAIAAAMEREPQLALRLLTHVADRERALERDIACYCFHSGCRRLVDFLLHQVGDLDGSSTVELSMSKRLLAARLGLTPESLSRALRELSTAGLIAVRGKRVTLKEALMARRRPTAAEPPAMIPTATNRRRSDFAADRSLPSRPVGSRAWV